MNIHGTIIMIMNEDAFTNFDIVRVLGHRWIQRRVTSIEGFRGRGSDVTLLCSCRSCKIWRFAFISMGRENGLPGFTGWGKLSWDCGSDEMSRSSTFNIHISHMRSEAYMRLAWGCQCFNLSERSNGSNGPDSGMPPARLSTSGELEYGTLTCN